MLVLTACAACADAPPSATAAQEELQGLLVPYGLEPEALPEAVALLAWQVPTQACAHAYRVSAIVEPVLMHEAPSISTFTLAAKDDAPQTGAAPPVPGQVVALDVYYRGLRAEKRGLIRDGWASAEFFGPAAPTAACTARTWDPVEDAFALGWPRLPARLVAVGETWTGLRVEGKCNRAACVDPNTGGGGPDNHHRACVTMSWQETLVGVYRIGDERVGLVRSHWDDGHAGLGLESDRVTLVSIDHGRPIWSSMTLQHRFPELVVGNQFSPVVRTWTLESADACAGSLASLGFARRPDDLADVESALIQLADIEGLRERDRRTTRMRDPDAEAFEVPPAP